MTQSTMLLSLAPELIQAISHELKSIEDVKSFRLTCKQTGEALATEVLRHITVNINEETYEGELRKLQYLASAAEGSSSCLMIIRGIRQVDIESLSPAINPKLPREFCEIEYVPSETEGFTLAMQKFWRADMKSVVAAETLEYYEEELKKCLHNALSSLTTVRAVRWVPAEKDSEWAQTTVLDALKTFTNLQSLTIQLESCRIEIPFHLFTALRHISVHCVSEEVPELVHHGKTFKNLVKMISQSPLLESIDFTNCQPDGYTWRNTTMRSLHHLFESFPEDESVPPLRLKHLSVTTCLVRLDDKTVMRHLRHLTSLCLEKVLQQFPEPERRSPWGSSDEQIWGTICNAGLRLEEITLSLITPAFLEYIGSYSGLKKLIIGAATCEGVVSTNSAATMFYEALEKHASSIEELDVNAYEQSLWCFGHHNKALFSTFQNLKTLNVKLRSNDFVRSSELGQPSGRQDIIKVLIDTAVIGMPQLQALTVCISDYDFHRPSTYGRDPHHRYLRYNPKIVSRVLKYKAPLGCKRLPIFTLNSPTSAAKPERVFVGQSPDSLKKGEELQYNDISPPEHPDNMDTESDDE
ncbi:hypothetical protein BYT27DRAFT_6712086 [Phlegmacium glaucopus]|nr:hypothetical protein BYT27DRAFT_6712086 [Phlegmacium glaucopus]